MRPLASESENRTHGAKKIGRVNTPTFSTGSTQSGQILMAYLVGIERTRPHIIGTASFSAWLVHSIHLPVKAGVRFSTNARVASL